jgi:4-amino-4-deoxy-L-arabinose transferase-like glycosyltransferase
MNKTQTSLLTELVTILAFCAFFLFYGLGSFGLVGADEPRYAQIAREMLARHNWVTPVLNGVAWLEKPILYYWGAMISYSVFGVSDWAARVPTAFMTTMMVFAIYAFMRRFRPGSQMDAALIAASLAGVIGFGRAASTDMPLAAMFTIGMLSWYVWIETQSKRFLVAFYVFIALATLAKGPVAPFLSALIIVVFAALRREWKLIVQTLWVPGILIYLAVALPWFVLVQMANPQFVRVFIFEHNLARFGTDMFRHKQPFWYFVPVLLAGLLPWVVLAVASFVRVVRSGIRERSRFELFFATWAILPVLFFSMSQSKLPGYILPAIPPFALLLANYLWQKLQTSERPALWLMALHSLIVSVLLGGALLTNYFVLKLKPTPTALWISVIVGLICCLAMLASIYATGLRTMRIATVIPTIVALAFVLKFASPSIDAKDSQRPVATSLNKLMAQRSGYAVAVYNVPRQVEYGLNFYENRPIERYEKGEIPAVEHAVITPPNFQDRLRLMVPDRTITPLGLYSAQKLEFYRVGPK